MRRKDREITDRSSIDQIIRRCLVCRLAVCDDGQPYVIPLTFGYDGHCLYFHSATAGKKLDILKRNNHVGFEFDILHKITKAASLCHWGATYESVVGSGMAEIVESHQDKVTALRWIIRQYGGVPGEFTERDLASVTVVRISVTSISGKTTK
jgi:nitroimidazol reductase NimA-like FMN-containing flavoprotein (pyridoxamine 5'-phosphate oxidase superfamily)